MTLHSDARPAARLLKPVIRYLTGFLFVVVVSSLPGGCASSHPPVTENVCSVQVSALNLKQLQYACDDLDTRGALEEMSGQPPSPTGPGVTDFRAEVRHDVRMARRVHPAVALNALTLIGGYFVFFFRVEADVVSKVTVTWRDGSEESFTLKRHGHYFHPGYLPPPPPDPAVRRILFYEDVQSNELRQAGREAAKQLLQRCAARNGGDAARRAGP